MRRKARRFKVGVTVIGSAVLFFGLVLFILGESLSTDLVRYDIMFTESVKGMVIGSKVNFQGIPVGAVSDIRFERGRTRVEISVDPDKAEIQGVTRARMDRLMVTGQVTIELEGYKADGQRIPDGALIPPGKSVFDEFTQSLPEVLEDADMLLISLRALSDRLVKVLDADNEKLIRQTLVNTERATRTLADGLQPLLTDARVAIAELEPVLKTTEASLATVGRVAGGKELNEALTGVRQAMRRVEQIEGEVLRLVTDLSGMVGSTRRGWFGTLGTARRALDEIRMLARNLRLAPSSLVFGRGDREIEVPATPATGGR